MSTRAPAARAGGSPAGDAPATIVTEPRFARPFRGAAAAASLGMDAGCQTEPLPQLEPLRRLRDAQGPSPERGKEAPGGKPISSDAKPPDADDLSADDLSEVFVRRRRRSSSVERENAALEIERVSVADFERRVAARREALVETGVLEGATRAIDGADARQKSARQKNKPVSPRGAVLTPEPPSGGFPKTSSLNAGSPLVVRRRPRALDAGDKRANEKKTSHHAKQNSLSGDGDFIAFDTTLPVPPASPSERDGRARGPTPAGRWGLRGIHAESGADSRQSSAPASPDSPDSDERERDVDYKNTFSRGASPSSPSRRRGIAIAGGARGRGLSPGRRVVSPGANGTLHFGSAAPKAVATKMKTSTLESKAESRGGGGGDGGDVDADVSAESRRFVSPSSPKAGASLSRNVNEVRPKKSKPRACVARRGVPVAAEFARGPALREEKSTFRVALSPERGVHAASGEPPFSSAVDGGSVVREMTSESDSASLSSVSILSRSLGSLGGLAGPNGENDPVKPARSGAFNRTDTSAFAVVKKKSFAPEHAEGLEPARARGDGAPGSAPEDIRGGSRAQKSVLTISLRGERSP